MDKDRLTRIRIIANFYRPPFRPSAALACGGWIETNAFGEFTNTTPLSVMVVDEVPTHVRIYAVNEDRLLTDQPLACGPAVARGDTINIPVGHYRRTVPTVRK